MTFQPGDRVMLRHATPGVHRLTGKLRHGTVTSVSVIEMTYTDPLVTVSVRWDGRASDEGMAPGNLIRTDTGADWPRDSQPDVGRIPGTPVATLPTAPLRPSKPQARVVDLPLFGDRAAELDRSQLDLLAPPETPP